MHIWSYLLDKSSSINGQLSIVIQGRPVASLKPSVRTQIHEIPVEFVADNQIHHRRVGVSAGASMLIEAEATTTSINGRSLLGLMGASVLRTSSSP